MIKNVNLMQNPNDIAWDQYSEEYIIQALANLGQRIGIKGDSIAYKSFTFNDILSTKEIFSSSEYVGYIEYIRNNESTIDEFESSRYKANFGIAKKLDLDDIVNIDTTLNINNALYFPSELSFTIPIGGIEKYSKNSICINENNELTYILAGKLIGYEDYDEYNTILTYEKFDIISNRLKYSAKLFHFYNDDQNGNYYCLINTKNNSYKEDKLSDKYIMTIYLFNDRNLEYDSFKSAFKEIFSFKNYNNIDTLPFNLLNPNFVDIDTLELYNDNANVYFESNSPVALILNNVKNNKEYIPQSIYLALDTEVNQLLAQDPVNYESVIDLYNNEFQLNLDEEIYLLNEDINHLYYNIFNYYNEKFYLEDRAAFIKRILAKTYEAVSNSKYNNAYRLYIPLDYKFHYICNNNNEMQIYYSNNIYISHVSLKTVNLDEFWESNYNLIYDYDSISKIKAYNFEINYNLHDNTIINSVLIKEIYTMPYINASNNWTVNDIDTKIKAIGADAGNPNIIIIYNNDKNDNSTSYNVLNAISNKKYVIGAEYNKTWFKVNTVLFENLYNDNVQCCAYIPKITDANFEYFKDSIILSISDLNCLKDEDHMYRYKGSYILSIWHLTENEAGEYEFTYIKHTDTDYALALGAAVNILNETNDASVANLNAQDLILLKTILNTVGQERLAINNNNWLIIKNKQAEEYVTSVEKNNLYNNDLNGIIQYNDTISLNSNYVIYSQNNKYISDLSNLNITNVIYPKYVITTSLVEGKEAVTKLKKVESQLATKVRESRVTVQGQLITNIESLIEELGTNEELVTELKDVLIESSSRTNSNYNEYVFNSNIPTLDFKEVFNRNVNVLNRLNIVSLDYNGKIYNSYIGSSFNESNKNVLHIGTSETNINLGTDTLMNEIDKSKFNTQSVLSLDFDSIILNAKNDITAATNILYQYSNNSLTYNMKTINAIDRFMSEKLPGMNETNIQTSWNNNESNLFAINRYYVPKPNTINDFDTYEEYLISVNYIMKKNFNINLDDYLVEEYNSHVYIHYNDYLTDDKYDPTLVTTSNPNNYYGKEIINIKRANKDIIYLINIPISIQSKLQILPNNVIYCPYQLNVMYYTTSIIENNQKFNAIHIYITFNK